MAPRLLARKRAIAAYAGIELDENGQPNPKAPQRPINLTKRGADVLVAHLAANPPMHDFVAKRLQFRGRAKALSLALDNLNSEINRVQSSRMGLLNALLSERSVFKIGVRSGAEMVKMNGRLYDPGQPYCKLIDNDDHGFDYTARARDDMRWERNIYRVNRELVRDCGLFNPREVDRLQAVWDRKTGSDGDGGAMTHILGGQQEQEAFVYDMVELMDVIFYNGDGTSYLCTCAGDPRQSTDWLRIEEWTGPERGPYEWLEFYPVPNNIMGVSWATVTEAQALIASKLVTKVIAGVLRQKRGMGVQGSPDPKEIDAVENGPDGFVANLTDLNNWKEMEVGGATTDSWKLLGPIMQWFSEQSGNTDVLGGAQASSSSDTLGEYQGMAANAGVVMSHLQRVSHEHEERKSRQLAFYLQSDPTRQFMMPHPVPNGEWLEVVYDPMAEEDDHTDYEYTIRDGSMKAVDPNQLLQRLTSFYEIFLPTGAIDVHEAALTFGELSGVPNMEAMVPDQARQMELQAAMQGVPPPMQGRVVGQSQANPAAFGQQPAAPAMGGMGGAGGAMPPVTGQPPQMPGMGMGGMGGVGGMGGMPTPMQGMGQPPMPMQPPAPMQPGLQRPVNPAIARRRGMVVPQGRPIQ